MPGLVQEVKLYNAAVAVAAQAAKLPPIQLKRGSSSPLKSLGREIREYVEDKIALCKPQNVHVCSGSQFENEQLLHLMASQGTIKHLRKYDNCWIARTNPKDVARVESKTFMCSEHKHQTVPRGLLPVSTLGNWISPSDYTKATQERFPGCMKGRTMYVIPFSMGPVGSPLSKIGIEITDSPYVVASMRIMTRMGTPVLNMLPEARDVVKCLHSVGTPANGRHEVSSWPCDPERTIIMHRPDHNEIISYGSGYGGNSLLGKKGFALRIGSTLAKKEGWLAEHMLILAVTNPQGVKRYIAAAFPSACGKTNLAMLNPTLPGYKVECVGDDIAWMRFDSKGVLRAINPENGFFGVAPGTSDSTNPNAMATIFKNTIFTNVASTGDGGVFWEGLPAPTSHVVDWKGRIWSSASTEKAAHPNSRFCSPAVQCPIMDAAWEDPEGVPISAILFGGRRPEGVPLVYEARDWAHGVFMGASMRSESTAAAEHKGKTIMHDPFAMRPFFGYNFGNYLQHWLSMEKPGRQMPKIFHVNWFRKHQGEFLWPGFGENIRVLDWVLRRVEGDESIATDSPLGRIPTPDGLPLQGLKSVAYDRLFDVPSDFWSNEVEAIRKYFEDQVGQDLPSEISEELNRLSERLGGTEERLLKRNTASA